MDNEVGSDMVSLWGNYYMVEILTANRKPQTVNRKPQTVNRKPQKKGAPILLDAP